MLPENVRAPVTELRIARNLHSPWTTHLGSRLPAGEGHGVKRARLIPVHGIGSTKEAEQRAASAVLAVLSVVRDLSVALFGPLGASRAQKAIVETFTEVEHSLDGKKWRPDGFVQISYGKATWSALVEVKTGSDTLTTEQINAYWDIARDQNIDYVLTISNEIAPNADTHPTPGLKVRSNSKVKVSHLSWTALLSTALTLKQHTGVDDPEQAYLLAELIRYLEHPASGTLSFNDMGPHWVAVRDAVRDVGATPKTEGLDDICSRWDQLLRYGALMLGANLGRDVTVVVPRSQQDVHARLTYLIDSLASQGLLTGAMRVPDTAGDIEIVADLRARQLVVSTEIGAPQDKGHRGRTGWLLRQLSDAPGQAIIDAYPKNARNPHTASLAAVREDRDLLAPDGKEAHKFRISLRAEMGLNRSDGGKRAGFVESVLGLIDTFYEQVVQDLTPWQPPAPKSTKTPSVPERDEEAGEAMRQAPTPVLIEAD